MSCGKTTVSWCLVETFVKEAQLIHTNWTLIHLHCGTAHVCNSHRSQPRPHYYTQKSKHVASQWCLGGNLISGRANPAPYGYQFLLLPFPSSPLLSYPASPVCQEVAAKSSYEVWGALSAFSIWSGRNPGNESVLVYFELRKCVWTILGFLWEPKCPAEVSEPKGMSIQTTLCKEFIDRVGSLYTIWHRPEVQDVSLRAPSP